MMKIESENKTAKMVLLGLVSVFALWPMSTSHAQVWPDPATDTVAAEMSDVPAPEAALPEAIPADAPTVAEAAPVYAPENSAGPDAAVVPEEVTPAAAPAPVSTTTATEASIPASRTLSSSEAWKLQLVSADEGKGVPFCAIYRTYEQGYELFLSMNPLGAMKVLVKLAPGQFISGKAYDVFLITDDGYEKAFQKKEVYQDSIDLGMGNDKKFVDSLGKSKTLSVKIDDALLDFKVPDMNKALQDLDYCISGGDLGPAEGAGLYDAPKSPEKKDPAAMAQQYDHTQSLLIGEASIPAPAGGDRLTIDEKGLLESLKKKMAILEKEKELLRAQLTNYRQEELSGLKEQMVTTQSAKKYEEKIAVLESKVRELQAANAGVTSASCPVAAVPPVVETAPLQESGIVQSLPEGIQAETQNTLENQGSDGYSVPTTSEAWPTK